MPLRNASPDRSRGLPTGNKHKAHRAQKHRVACAAYRRAGKREINRDRRLARIMRGMRGEFVVSKDSNSGSINIVKEV